MNTTDLKRMAAGDDAHARTLAATLGQEAASRGLLDVAVAELDSPIGRLLVAVTPRGLARVAFEEEDRDRVLAQIAKEISPRILESAAATDEARRELEEFFQAERTRFAVKVDRRLIRGIARDVLRATSAIPYGRMSTYGAVARQIGRPTAARAVGRALGSNPIPIVIPCHRVIGASGALTGYAGGLERKIALLELEGSLPGL
ncbi:MAG: methylated-DNA--[protein]-cysteine S-methyltransferase [Actinomycetota bacterium]